MKEHEEEIKSANKFLIYHFAIRGISSKIRSKNSNNSTDT